MQASNNKDEGKHSETYGRVIVKDEVVQWAEAEDLMSLLPALNNAGFINIKTVCCLDRDDLAAMGIDQPGDQKRLMNAVNDLKEKNPSYVRVRHEPGTLL
jgi:hypothetical protein